MCKKKEDTLTRAESDSDSFSPYDEDISRFFDKASGFTKKVVGHTFDLASDLPSMFKEQEEHFMDRFMNRPYQTRDKDLDSDRSFHPFGMAFDALDVFGGSSGDTPFGLYSYKSPSVRKYNECMRKDGESVWDTEGYWRCLFPNREIPNKLLNYKKNHLSGHILTKEDFNEAIQEHPGADKNGVIDLGPKGMFFREFNRYLNWKNHLYEDVRRQREESRRNLRESMRAANPFTPENEGQGQPDEVVSYSTKIYTNYDRDNNNEVMHETKTEVMADGRSVTTKLTRTRPIGSTEWLVADQLTEEDNKLGWFWNSK